MAQCISGWQGSSRRAVTLCSSFNARPKFHCLRTRGTLLKYPVALPVCWPEQQLPSTRLGCTWVANRICPWWWQHCCLQARDTDQEHTACALTSQHPLLTRINFSAWLFFITVHVCYHLGGPKVKSRSGDWLSSQVFHGLPRSLQRIAGILPQIRPQPFPSASLPIHYSS